MLMYYISAENPSFFKIIEYKFLEQQEEWKITKENTMKCGGVSCNGRPEMVFI
jgi:hypothetical protein